MVRKALIGVVLALAVALAISWGWNAWKDSQAAGLKDRVEKGQGDAFRNSAVDAIDAQGDVHANDAATDKLGDEHEKTIRTAPGADQPISGDLNRAGRRGMCDYKANRNKPECRVQLHNPR